MNATTPCNCANCPGKGCTCGCQGAPVQPAMPNAGCACGPQCRCGPTCACVRQ